MNDRLYRSRDERILGGVCAGLADRLDIDPSLVRVIWVIATILTGFVFGILLYVLLLIVVPEAPAGWLPGASGYPPPMPPRPDAAPGWTPPDVGPAAATTAAAFAATGGPSSSGESAPAGDPGSPAVAGSGAETAWTPPPPAAAPTGWTPPPGQGGWTPPATPPGSAAGGDAWMAADAAYAARRAERRARRRHDERIVGLVFGVLLILVGVWFLLREYLPEVDFDRFWPLIIVGLGVVLLVAAVARGRGGDSGTSA